MIENLKLPKSHEKILKQMKILVEKQESFFNDGNTNIRTCDEEDSVSPKRIFGKLSYWIYKFIYYQHIFITHII